MIIGKYPGPGAPSAEPPGMENAGIIKKRAKAMQIPTKTKPALFMQPPKPHRPAEKSTYLFNRHHDVGHFSMAHSIHSYLSLNFGISI